MHSRELLERVAFDAPTTSSDGYGGTIEGWTAGPQVGAHFRFLRGGETVMADRLAGRQPIIATVRNTEQTQAVTTGHRMRDMRTGQTYNVRTNVPTDDRVWRELLCETGVAV